MNKIILILLLAVVGCRMPVAELPPPAPCANPNPPVKLRMVWTRDASLQMQFGGAYDTYIGRDTKTEREYMLVLGSNSVSILPMTGQ